MATPESQADPTLVPSLDPTLLTLSDDEKSFLHQTISLNDEVVRERVLELQRR